MIGRHRVTRALTPPPGRQAPRSGRRGPGGRRAGLGALRRLKIPRVPLFFLGIGVYRAWIEIAFVGSFLTFPALPAPTREWFDIACTIVMILCALLARRIGPFYRRRGIFVLSGAAMTLSTAMLFATMLVPGGASYLGCRRPCSAAAASGSSSSYGARCTAA